MIEGESSPSREGTESLKIKIYKMRLIQSEYTASYCLDTQNFTDTYSSDEINADNQYVADFRETIDKEHEELGYSLKETEVLERSKTMEKIVPVQGELAEWFGPYAVVVKTTEYDDVKNGIDFVIEFDVPNPNEIGIGESIQRLAIAVDATTSPLAGVVEKKVNRALDKVLRGGGTVKYFDSQVEDFKGKLEHVVPVIIGIEAKNIYGLIENVFEYIRLGQIPSKERTEVQQQRFSEVKRNVEQSPAQMVFLREMSLQLELYAEKLQGIKARTEMLAQVTALKKIIDSIFDEKYEAGMDLGFMVNDKTLKLIERVTRDA